MKNRPNPGRVDWASSQSYKVGHQSLTTVMMNMGTQKMVTA
ncbi:hypothetical protein [Trueperella pyogenes]|nr:hypothetical protein [Trueperella pyogenes]